MNGLTFPDLPSAQAFQAQVDAALGYPRPGVDVGDGVHAPPSQSLTATYMVPVQLATAGFGFPVDDVILPHLPAPQAATITALTPKPVAIALAPTPDVVVTG